MKAGGHDYELRFRFGFYLANISLQIIYKIKRLIK